MNCVRNRGQRPALEQGMFLMFSSIRKCTKVLGALCRNCGQRPIDFLLSHSHHLLQIPSIHPSPSPSGRLRQAWLLSQSLKSKSVYSGPFPSNPFGNPFLPLPTHILLHTTSSLSRFFINLPDTVPCLYFQSSFRSEHLSLGLVPRWKHIPGMRKQRIFINLLFHFSLFHLHDWRQCKEHGLWNHKTWVY